MNIRCNLIFWPSVCVVHGYTCSILIPFSYSFCCLLDYSYTSPHSEEYCVFEAPTCFDQAYYFCRLPRFRWDVIWLPFGPIRCVKYHSSFKLSIQFSLNLSTNAYVHWNCSGTGLSLYVDHLLLESSEEIRKLRGYMYAYKASWTSSWSSFCFIICMIARRHGIDFNFESGAE